MNTNLKCGLVGVMIAASHLSGSAVGAVTNAVPWSDSFESYTNGMSVIGTNGWSAQTSAAGMVTNDPVRTGQLADYLAGGGTYPLPSLTHTNILKLNAEVANALQSAGGGVVVSDIMAYPTWSDVAPGGQTNDQCAFYVATNGLLTLWHQNRSGAPVTNEWLTLTNSAVIGTNAWMRLTVVHDYSNLMYQVRINAGAPLVDGKGWAYGGASQGGSWFYMVQTNHSMSCILAEASLAYLDDVTTARRALAWSRTNFIESLTNNGAMDNSQPLSIVLVQDTFNGLANSDLVTAGKVVVSGLPSNLIAVATIVNSTNVSLTLTNRALWHEAGNSISNLVVQFADNAFTLGRAWDVTGCRQTNALTFMNTPALGYSAAFFAEGAANNGTIDNTSPLLLTLTNATFVGTVGENFATNALKLQIQYLPAGLTGEVLMLSSTQLQVRLLGAASLNNAANNTNIQFQILAGALSLGTTPLASVLNMASPIGLSFSDAATLTYGTATFTEKVANDGSVNGTTLTLANKTFNAGENEELVTAGKITFTNKPAGLGIEIRRNADAHSATLVFTGKATAHAVANSLSNLGITLTEAAVVGGNVAGVVGYTRSNLAIQYNDPRTLSYSGSTFSEISVGIMDNRQPVTITLSGDTLTGTNGSDFVAAGRVSVANLPAGLTASITRDSATQLSVRLLGAALNHGSVSNVNNVTFTFQDGAFGGVNASYVVNYQKADLQVTFNDWTGSYNVIPFEDSFESYAAGARIDGSNSWVAEYTHDAGITTNNAALMSGLANYKSETGRSYPIVATHTQVLFVQDYLRNDIHSQTATNVFIDFMMIPSPVAEVPVSDTNDQFACYVSTNQQLVIWQRNVALSTNAWLTLSNAPGISTSAWMRLTFESDFEHNMFQVSVNEGRPVSDPQGWTRGGVAPTGTWFHMVQTRGTMTTFKLTGNGVSYLDDFTVRAELPESYGGLLKGSVFLIR